MVLASFAADSLALGAHWIYDPERIVKTFGRVTQLLKPREDSYHPSKGKGDFTHYGDQTLVLLESLAACGKFDLSDFARRWRTLFDGYSGYVDRASRTTLERFAAGSSPEEAGSASNDLSAAARLAPLLLRYAGDEQSLMRAARLQAAMTHNHPQVVESAEFFARVGVLVLQGMKPVRAFEEAAGRHTGAAAIPAWVTAGLGTVGDDTVAAVQQLGQSCHAPDAFPAVVHLIAKYEDRLADALVENVMAGGDSAARGMLVGMILGAHLGDAAVPSAWLDEMRGRPRILECLARLQQAADAPAGAE
jgi:ADP-ribosylglycohydrolase